MNNIDKIIGSRIKIERSRLNIEQKDLAEKVGISNKTISKYELGNAKPSIEVLIKLANIFDCTSDYLLGRTNNRDALVFEGDVDGDHVKYDIDKCEKDLPDSQEKLEKLTRSLKKIGFDVDKLIELDLNND